MHSHQSTSNEKIKVGFVINDLLLGGAQMVVYELATRLNHEQFEPVVYYLHQYDEERRTINDKFAAADIPTVYVGTGGKTSFVGAVKALYRQWRQDRPQVVHAHLPFSVLPAVIASLGLPGLKVVAHEHQTPTHFSWKIRLLYRLLRPFITHTICYAESVEKEIFGSSELWNEPPRTRTRRSSTILNGVPVDSIMTAATSSRREDTREELGWSQEDVVVISVGRFVEWKGQKNLVEAFLLAAEKNPQLRLCLVGDGPDRAGLIDRVHGHPAESRIQFLGDRTDVYRLLAAADIFSLVFSYPAGNEGEAVGLAGLEGMAIGLPVLVASGLPMVPGLQHHKNLYTVTPHTPEALAEVLVTLAAEPEQRQALGDRARDFCARNLDWQVIVIRYEHLYKLLVSQNT